MEFFKVQKQEVVLSKLQKLATTYSLETEVITLDQASGRIISTDIVASEDVPSYNRSTVDGYAIKSVDSHGASSSVPSFITNKGQVDMGKITNLVLNSTEGIYVPTGGMVPKGADTMIMIEDTEVLGEETIALNKTVSTGQYMILKGDDIKEGSTLFKRGHQLSTMDIGALAALGLYKINVYKMPKIHIISTGDEIVDPSIQKGPGEIYDINGYVLKQLAVEAGAHITCHEIIKDDYHALFQAVSKATETSDIVLLSGGSSVGTRDYTYDVIRNLNDGQLYVQGIAIKPGKPTLIGTGNGKLVVGLPGHPVSAIMVYKIFVNAYITYLTSHEKREEKAFSGILTENVHSSPGKTTYQMVELSMENDQYTISPKNGKSGMISLLTSATGYIVLDSHVEGLEAGSLVRGYYL